MLVLSRLGELLSYVEMVNMIRAVNADFRPTPRRHQPPPVSLHVALSVPPSVLIFPLPFVAASSGSRPVSVSLLRLVASLGDKNNIRRGRTYGRSQLCRVLRTGQRIQVCLRI